MMHSRRSTETRSTAFSERGTWRHVGAGWKPLFGSFRGLGCSIEWHDFRLERELDWGATFHPDCVELCLNISGEAYVEARGSRAQFAPATAGFYYRHRNEQLEARRAGNQQHQFLTIEFSCPFLAKHLSEMETALHPAVCAAIKGCPCEHVSGATVRLTTAHRQIIETLRLPPVYAAAQPLWYQCKALELAVTFLTQPPAEAELFCTRHQRLAEERVEQVRFLLRQNLAEPPSLEQLGKEIGCSQFYLSRLFSTHTGQTIPQYLRQLRMEKASELLRSGEYNVTEAALEVGYNSLSHFSAAFHETFGCCPGLYPLQTPAQRRGAPKR